MEKDIMLDATLQPTTWVVATNGNNPVCEVGFTAVENGILVEVTRREEENTELTLLMNEEKIVIMAKPKKE